MTDYWVAITVLKDSKHLGFGGVGVLSKLAVHHSMMKYSTLYKKILDTDDRIEFVNGTIKVIWVRQQIDLEKI